MESDELTGEVRPRLRSSHPHLNQSPLGHQYQTDVCRPDELGESALILLWGATRGRAVWEETQERPGRKKVLQSPRQ